MNFNKLIEYFNLDKQEFQFQFNSHPNYPSALAFSDTLGFMGIKNDAYELEKEYWDELPEEYIAIVDNSFSLVKKTGNTFKVYSEDVKTFNKEELYKNSADFILLFEKTETFENKSHSNFKPLILTIFIFALVYSVISFPWYCSVFNALSLIGVYISLEIFNQKFGVTSTMVESICGTSSSTQKINSCNKIIGGDKTNIVGLKFADLSLIYFISLSLLGLLLPSTSYIILGLSLISSISIGYSLYIQAFVEKTFCKVCLLIISILVAQLVISVLFFQESFFNFRIILLSIVVVLVPLAIIFYINKILKEKDSLQKSNTKNLRFKRNYELFKSELLKNEKIHFPTKEPFFLGNKDAKVHISVVSNPYCGFCKDAHKILEKLLEKYPDDISAQIRFNYLPENNNDKYTQLVSDFTNIYNNKTEKEFLSAVEEWYENKDESQIQKKTTSHNENLEDIIITTKENLNAGLSFTPVFIINGRQFPDKYDREDIFYFIEELVEDEEIS